MTTTTFRSSVEDYHRHIPVRPAGDVFFSSDQDSIKLQSFILPPTLDAAPSPLIDQHCFGVTLTDSQHVKVNKGLISGEKVFSGFYPRRPISVLPKNETIAFQWHSKNKQLERENLVIFIPNKSLDRLVLENFDIDPRYVELIPRIGAQCDFVTRFAKQLLLELRSGSAMIDLYMQHATQFFIINMLKNWCSLNYSFKNTDRKLPSQTLSCINDYLHEHVCRTVSLRELAELAACSDYHFIRLFKASTGQTPHQYVLSFKIKKAKALLKAGKTSLTDIAYSLGFSDASHFSSVFRRLVGVAPSRYRNN